MMGEIADMMINGEICHECHTPFSEENGFPVLCKVCWQEAFDSGRVIKHSTHTISTNAKTGQFVSEDTDIHYITECGLQEAFQDEA